MREILFRGRRKNDGKWCYGDFIRCGVRTYIRDRVEYYYTEVEPETIGEFTGALDCYEKKIYEGDILRYTTDYDGLDGFTRTIDTHAVVVWDLDVLGFACKEIGDESGDLYSWLEMRENPDIEIIGNIYDNPELLGASEYADNPAEQPVLAPAT